MPDDGLIKELETVTVGEMIRNAGRYMFVLALVFAASFVGSLILFLPYRVLALFVGHAEVVFLVMVLVVADCVGIFFDQWNKKLRAGKIVRKKFSEVLKDMQENSDIIKTAFLVFYVKITLFIAVGYLFVGWGLIGLLALFVLVMIDTVLERYSWSIGNVLFRLMLRTFKREKLEEYKDVNPLQTILGGVSEIVI